MKKNVTFKFVKTIPDSLDSGIVYITTYYNTAVHKCMCGCGNEVVTPLSPSDWELTYNGEQISLYPSIGNWSFECQSHYWIKNNKVIWAEKWSKRQIKARRRKQSRERSSKSCTKSKPVLFWNKLISYFTF
ncbi:DUF6527 family protein [Mangrovibacterium diazotrophicum]|uniref:Uncharacterized protein n=1 Tax=Mangrovibacterium diazotrophicum TaxID=1261403 RepID=A0A419WAU0_9BACT|nr:hypothetical protein BC643_2896 [Mangrovibacterium diazotrophicum]